LVSQFGIGATLSPRTASANAVLRELRGTSGNVTTFLDSDVEANEFEVRPGCTADGAMISELGVPTGILLGAVVRPDSSVEIAGGRTALQAGDKVVVFAKAKDLPQAQHFFM
jgi:trk system potassium uptake protein TrkA